MGTGLADGDAIKCANDITDNFPSDPTCILYHGSTDFGIDAYIEITWSSSNLATNTEYKLLIYQIVNPTLYSDDRHLDMVMKSFDS